MIKHSNCYLFLYPLLLVSPLTTPVAPPRAVQERAYSSAQFREYQAQAATVAVKPFAVKDAEISPEAKVEVETVSCAPGYWRIIMRFPETVYYTRQRDGDAILLEFNQPIDSPGLTDAQTKTGYLLQSFGNGFNTLYLVPRISLTFVTSSEGNCFFLDLIPNYDLSPEPTRLLKLAYARFLIETRCYLAAFDAIHELLRMCPCDRDGLVLLAELESLLPRWQKAVQILKAVKAHNPWDVEVSRLMCDIFCPHSSFLRYTRQVQRTRDFAVEQIHRAQGEAIIRCSDCYYLYAGGLFEARTGHLSQVVNDVGETVGFKGTRYGGGLYLRNEHISGLATTARLWVTEGVVWGAGAEISWLWPKIQGQMGVLADWHKPYWDLFETIPGFGREDRFKFYLNGVKNRFLYWNFEGGIHRVGIRGVPNALTSLLANGNIFYNLNICNPQLALNYGLDAEWVIHHAEKVAPSGETFEPVPLASYEFHSVRLYLFYEWRDFWFLTIFGGETFDRLGGNSPTGGIILKYVKPCPCGWEVELSAIAYPNTQELGATTEYFTANVTIRF